MAVFFVPLAALSALTFEQASKLFEEGNTGDAGVALEAYAGQRPSPPRRAEALLLLGRCHERRRDFAKARRQFEQITQDGVMRRKEPGAVAEAYDRLHALLVSQGASALTRRRIVDAARRDIRESEAFSHICEREGDALVIAGDMRGALASYEAAPAISEAGESVRGLLKAGFARSRKISDSDIAALLKVAKSKADLVRPLCMALSKCREGWMAEDFLASHCLSNGKGDEAAKIWKDMLRRKAGPADAIAYSHCEALAATNPKSAIAELDKWLATYADSPLAEKALLVQARLEAAHGDKERAATLFEQYLAGHPQGKLVDVARNGLDEVRQSMARQAEQKARETERAEARRNNPDMAKVEAAEALLNQRRYREAAREFNALSHAVRQPLRDRVLLGLGEALRGQEDYQGAIAALNSIVRNASSATNAPITAKAHRAIGDIFLEDTGDHAKALSAYEKSLSFQPDIDDSGFWMNYGIAMMASGRDADAVRIFEERRGRAGKDLVAFAKWDNLAKLCAQGRKDQGKALIRERKALAALQVAEALHEGGAHARALKIFKAVAAEAGRAGAGDRCAFGAARCLAALGKTRDALKAYGEFEKNFAGSPLAPTALLYAGVLHASPENNDFNEARKVFDSIVAKYPKAPEAEAAEFYSATLAWRGRKWNEAERLHRAFIERHPDSPLASVALDERLPAIAKKSLDVPKRSQGENHISIVVSPYDRTRNPVYLVGSESSHNAILELTPQIGWRFDPTGIVKQDSRGAGVLWTGPNPATPHRQVYSLSSAFSSQEFIMIDGRLVPEGTGKRPVKDPFRVTVPTADIDWSGFDKALDENGEDVRRVIVPFNASDTNNTRRVLINSPFDDDGRHGRPGCNFGSAASPRITLRWTPMDCLQLTNRYDGVIPNGWSVDADDVGGWPLGFYVDPQKWKNDFVISCEEWNGGNGDVAMDSIHGRIVDVDLDVDANYDGIINEDDEPLEETQGGLVGGELVPIRLRVLPPGLPGKVSLVVTSDVARVKLWKDGNRTEEVELRKTWNAGETVPSILYVEGIAPSAAMRDIKMTLLYDENPDGQSSPLLKCEDCVKFTSNKAQMIGYAAWRGTDGKAVPDEEKDNPGFLVTEQSSGHLSAKVQFKGLPNVGLLRYYKFSRAGLVLANGQTTTTAEVAIPYDDDFDMTLDMTDPSNWGNNSYVDVEYILRDAQGNLFDKDKCRLLRPYIVAVGDSLTYGLMRYGSNHFITPKWKWKNNPYPTASDWANLTPPVNATPPYNASPDRTSLLYQGYRGHLSQSLSGFTWLGFDTNGHGPKHCGLPGAKIHETFTHATFQSTLAMQNTFLIIVMMAGANDAINSANSGTIKTQWEDDANMISTSRMNGGRTLLLALKVPQISSRYGGLGYATIANNITQLNDKISSWSAPAGCRFVISSIVETGGIPHDDNDDGLHFLSTGYQSMAQIIFNALKEGLKLCDSAKAGN